MPMDLVYRMITDVTQFAAGQRVAQREVAASDRGLDKLIGTMRQQQQVSEYSARQSAILALADKGATAAKVDYALQLAGEIDALERLQAAEAEEAQQKAAASKAAAAEADRLSTARERQAQAGAQLLSGLLAERVALQDGAAAAQVYAISKMEISRADKEAAIAILQSNAAISANAGNQAWIEKEIQSRRVLTQTVNINVNDWHREAVAVGALTLEEAALRNAMEQQTHYAIPMAASSRENTRQKTLQEAATRGATEAQLEEIQAGFRAIDKERQLAAALERRNASTRLLTQGTMGHTGASKSNLFAIQAAAFGLQDAAQVYGTTGLAGAISASANNLIFMTSILSPHLAIVTAVTVAVGQFAAVLGPTILGVGNAAKALEKQTEQNKALLKSQDDVNASMREFKQALAEADTYSEGKSLVKQKESKLADIAMQKDQVKAQIEELQAEATKAAQAREKEMQSLTVGGHVATNLGIRPEMTSQAEVDAKQDAANAKLQEWNKLQQEQLRTEKELKEAKDKTAGLDAEKRQLDARKYAKEQREKLATEETNKEQKEREEAARASKKGMEDLRKLERDLYGESLSEQEEKRQRIRDEFRERVNLISQQAKEERISGATAASLTIRAREAADNQLAQLDGKDADKQAKADKSALAARKAFERKSTKDDLQAVEANSSDGFKKVFEATSGQGFQDPLKDLVLLAKGDSKVFANLLQAAQAQLKETKKNKGVVVGKKGG